MPIRIPVISPIVESERLYRDMIRTVMVVEDDDAIRMVLRTNLEDEG